LSFSSDKTPWTPYSWLAELFMKAVWDAFGYRGTIFITAICSAAIVWLISQSCFEATRRRTTDGSAMTTAVGTVLAAYFTLAYISFRPVTFALVLFAAIIWLLWRDRRTPSRWTWLVPALIALMTNLHLYGIVAAGLVVAVAIGTFFDHRRLFPRMAWLAGLSAFAACCTPMLPGMIETALRYNAVDPMVSARFISEMRPFYEGTAGIVSLLIIAGLLAWTIVRRKRLNVVDWVLLIAGLVLLFRLGRFSPLFAMLSLPVFCSVLPVMNDRALRRRPVRIAIGTVLVIGALNLAWAFPRGGTSFNAWLNRHAPHATAYPTAAADWATANVPVTHYRVINEFDWGGYLAWRLGPSWRVFMDGRTQLYPPAFWQAAFFDSPEAQEDLLASVRADFAILPMRRSALRETLERLEWRVVYQDDVACVLTKKKQGR
ncbi:MAG TPA: hypothetical protein VGB55_08310, partial [Tepidisphaeraceae bacterium]